MILAKQVFRKAIQTLKYGLRQSRSWVTHSLAEWSHHCVRLQEGHSTLPNSPVLCVRAAGAQLGCKYQQGLAAGLGRFGSIG